MRREFLRPGAARELSDHFIRIQAKDILRPRDKILHALTCWLASRPKFKIVWAIVSPISVLVVRRFIAQQKPADFLGH
jgi:hypothetical protein